MLLVMTLILAIADGSVRTRQWVKYGYFGRIDDLYSVDHATGLQTLKSNASTRRININSLGFRGPPVKQAKATGQLRLAFLGASTSFYKLATIN